jgi:alkanesulfonate monooxygenase SsuD/methylene tetrahydromethanopterin reductase-like flavin-dependent oxidoreductase (luciferase family)
MPIEFGVFDHVDRSGGSLTEFYANRLRIIERYDEHGFFAYHVAEHHGTALGMAPSPGIFLASAAQRTSRLRLAAMVYVLPAHNPLRLIEEICMLDHLSGGRIEVGLGRGSSPYELAFFDVPQMRSRAMSDEICSIVLAGLAAETLTFRGTYYSYDAVPMVLGPNQRPHPPLWHGLVRADGVAWPAARRMNIVVNGQADAVRPLIDAYRAEWRALHGDLALPKLGLSRHIVVGDSDEAARDIARSAYTTWFASNDSLWRRNGSHSLHFPATFDEAVQRGTLIAGSPDTVSRALARDIATCGATYLLSRFAFGEMAMGDVLHSVDLFARDVMSALRAEDGIAGARA